MIETALSGMVPEDSRAGCAAVRSVSQPLVVGLGGTVAPGSSTEQALSLALRFAERSGARVKMFGCETLVSLPHYMITPTLTHEASEFIATVRSADALIIASPGYHGGVSGLVKNALDYLEETASDSRPYLDGLPVGLIATAYGWPASNSTLSALRDIVHALRGWPTPLGAALNSSGGTFREGECHDSSALAKLQIIGAQVADFARMRLNAAQSAAGGSRSVSPAQNALG